MKQIGRRRGITPFAILKCGHVEMQKHAETQIHESLLQFYELPSPAGSHATCFVLCSSRATITKQHCGSRSCADQLEKLSSCRHFNAYPPGPYAFWTSNQHFPEDARFQSNTVFECLRTMRPIRLELTLALISC